MAFKRIGITWCPDANDYQQEFILDSVEDKANLPKCAPGSIAIVPKGGKIFMANTSGEWDSFTGSEG